jgi:Mat/Ecp fimbriae major subunit
MVLAVLSPSGAPAWAACNKAITLAETQQMNYGTIAAASAGGTVTMGSSGTVSAPAGFTLSGVTAVGAFHLTGSPNCSVTISFVAGLLAGPGTSMAIQNFTSSVGTNPTINPPGGGQLDFNVGADLIVHASQAGGSYSGTYTVTAIY